MKKRLLFVSLFLISILFISSCAEMAPYTQIDGVRDSSRDRPIGYWERGQSYIGGGDHASYISPINNEGLRIFSEGENCDENVEGTDICFDLAVEESAGFGERVIIQDELRVGNKILVEGLGEDEGIFANKYCMSENDCFDLNTLNSLLDFYCNSDYYPAVLDWRVCPQNYYLEDFYDLSGLPVPFVQNGEYAETYEGLSDVAFVTGSSTDVEARQTLETYFDSFLTSTNSPDLITDEGDYMNYQNLILIGSPCANDAVAYFLGLDETHSDYPHSGYIDCMDNVGVIPENAGYIRLARIHGISFLIVSGWGPTDVRRAADAIAAGGLSGYQMYV